ESVLWNADHASGREQQIVERRTKPERDGSEQLLRSTSNDFNVVRIQKAEALMFTLGSEWSEVGDDQLRGQQHTVLPVADQISGVPQFGNYRSFRIEPVEVAK